MNGPLNFHPKAAGAGIGGSLGIIVVWMLGLAHVQVDPVVGGAIATTLGTFAAWLAPVLPNGGASGSSR